MNYLEEIKKSIQEADKVLIGIGAELDVDFAVYKEKNGLAWDTDGDNAWRESYIRRAILQNTGEFRQDKAYQTIKEWLEGKDYYIISLTMDDVIYRTFSKEEPVVTPCGGLSVLQCENACMPMLYPATEQEADLSQKVMAGEWDGEEALRCPSCQKRLVWNNLYAENYLEEGYLDKFGEYKKWLQSTVNRKLCILELGVGMKFPSVIRFAFDKLAFYNQKSVFYRVHETLYQHTSENKERGISVPKNALEFLEEAANIEKGE